MKNANGAGSDQTKWDSSPISPMFATAAIQWSDKGVGTRLPEGRDRRSNLRLRLKSPSHIEEVVKQFVFFKSSPHGRLRAALSFPTPPASAKAAKKG